MQKHCKSYMKFKMAALPTLFPCWLSRLRSFLSQTVASDMGLCSRRPRLRRHCSYVWGSSPAKANSSVHRKPCCHALRISHPRTCNRIVVQTIGACTNLASLHHLHKRILIQTSTRHCICLLNKQNRLSSTRAQKNNETQTKYTSLAAEFDAAECFAWA